MSLIKVKAIILKKRNFREHDRIFLTFTESEGKREFLGRATRKKESKLAGLLEPFSTAEIIYAPGRSYDYITTVKVIRRFRKASMDPKIIFLMGPILELIEKYMKQKKKEIKIFLLLGQLFSLLEEGLVDEKKKIILLSALLKIISLLGYQPELYFCQKCHQRVKPGKIFFSFSDKGLICPKCANHHKEISEEAVKIMRFFIEEDLSAVVKMRIKKETLKEVSEIIFKYLSDVFESNFNSVGFAKKVFIYK